MLSCLPRLSHQLLFQDRKRPSSFKTYQDTHTPSFLENRSEIPWLYFYKKQLLFSKEFTVCGSRIRPWEGESFSLANSRLFYRVTGEVKERAESERQEENSSVQVAIENENQ